MKEHFEIITNFVVYKNGLHSVWTWYYILYLYFINIGLCGTNKFLIRKFIHQNQFQVDLVMYLLVFRVFISTLELICTVKSFNKAQLDLSNFLMHPARGEPVKYYQDEENFKANFKKKIPFPIEFQQYKWSILMINV